MQAQAINKGARTRTSGLLTQGRLTPKKQKILDLKTLNPEANSSEIARQANADVSYTIDVLKRYGLLKQNIDDFTTNRVSILRGLQSRILSSISQEDIQKASLQQKVTAVGIIHDKERELEGFGREAMPMVIINKIQVGQVEATGKQGEIIDLNNSQILCSTTTENTTTK